MNDMKAKIKGIGQALVELFGAPVTEVAGGDGKRTWVAVREGYKVQTHAGPEKIIPGHEFYDLRDFAAWLKVRADKETTDVAIRSGRAEAMLNLAENDGRIYCSMREHPRLKAWKDAFSHTLTQQGLIDTVIGAADDFEAVVDRNGEPVGLYGAEIARQLMKFSVATSGEFKHEVDEMGVVRFSGKSETTAVQGRLPASFNVVIPWFISADPDARYTLKVLIRMTVHNGQPAFKLRCPGLEVAAHNAMLEASDYLRAELGDGWLVGLGTLDTNSVPE